MRIERFKDIEAWQPARELASKDEEYISPGEFNNVYEQARRTRAAVRRTTLRLSTGGFINYLKKYEKLEATNGEP